MDENNPVHIRRALLQKLITREERKKDPNKKKIKGWKSELAKPDEELDLMDLVDPDEQQNPNSFQENSGSNTSSTEQDQGGSSNTSAGDPAQQDQGGSSNTSAGDPAQQDQEGSNMQSADNANIKKEPHDDKTSLFVPEAHAKSDSDLESDSEFDHGPPLYDEEKPSIKVKKRTVGWLSHGSSITYINMYGRRNGPIYRLEDEAHTAEYEKNLPEHQNYDRPNRYGEVEVPGTTKLLYKSRNISNIYGVAWEGHGGNTDRLKTDLDLIDPKCRPSGSRRRKIYIYVEWEVERYNKETKVEEKVRVKKWETYSALKRRYKKRTEGRVFEAAIEFHKRYENDKHRTSPSRSPSVGAFDEATMRRYRDESSPGSQSPEPTTTAITGGPLSSMEHFLKMYLQLAKKNSFEELSPDQQAKAVIAWGLANTKQ
jgi:hypothetical protein